jgi:hypothetical protein
LCQNISNLKIRDGYLSYDHHDRLSVGGPPGWTPGWEVRKIPLNLQHWLPLYYNQFKVSTGQWLAICLPLWIPFLIFAIPTALLWWRDRRRIPLGHCQHCGYNLTGNVSGVCPECGERI